mmetsp:Transcript_2808/g.6260  ORF Transcript_2808/g.6260 Transcript_2808/m.6260 type:complete len:201 (-) Transcript_2808:57-659(-)
MASLLVSLSSYSLPPKKKTRPCATPQASTRPGRSLCNLVHVELEPLDARGGLHDLLEGDGRPRAQCHERLHLVRRAGGGNLPVRVGHLLHGGGGDDDGEVHLLAQDRGLHVHLAHVPHDPGAHAQPVESGAVLPQGDHVIRARRVVVKGVLGQGVPGVRLILPNVYGDGARAVRRDDRGACRPFDVPTSRQNARSHLCLC